MAREQGVCAAWVFQLIDDYLTGNTIKMALFTSDAELSPDTETYTTTNEVSGTGYTAGGVTLTLESGTPQLDSAGRTVMISFEDATFSSITVSDIRLGQIYASTDSNRSIAILDFGTSISRSGQDFVVPSPPVTTDQALIRAFASGQ